MNEKYSPLYPLLEKCWGKTLSGVPKEIRERVKQVCPKWGRKEFFSLSATEKDKIEKRKKIIRDHDWIENPTQEFKTWHALFQFIQYDDGVFGNHELEGMIDKAHAEKQASIERNLRDISSRLREITNNGMWPNSQEPILWRELYKFSQSLLTMRGEAVNDKNDVLALALDIVIEHLENILDIDRSRVGAEVIASYEAEKEVQSVPIEDEDLEDKVAMKKTKQQSTDNPWSIKCSSDPKPEQPWYTAARYFARQLVKENSTLLTKRVLLSHKVELSLYNAGIYKRGGKKKIAASTILKALSNVTLG